MGNFESDRQFKIAIGAFIIAFSELEFGLAFLCSMTEFDIRQKDKYLTKYLSFPFEKKIKHLSNFIDEHLTEVKSIWNKLKIEIGQLNRERRFLVHGFMTYSLPDENITTYIKEKGEIVEKKQTIAEIYKYTNKLHDINTGKNGINGSFHILFTKLIVNKWNNLVNDDNKVIYKVNNEIISEWKGSDTTDLSL